MGYQRERLVANAMSKNGNTGQVGQLDVEAMLAVGVPCGSMGVFLGGGTGMHIRFGGIFTPISRGAYAAWWQLLRPRKPNEIRAWIEMETLGDGQAILHELESAQAVIRWTGAINSDMVVLSTLRIVPLGIGMGSNDAFPEECVVQRGMRDDKVILDPVSYAVWVTSDGHVSLGQACRKVSAAMDIPVLDVWHNIYASLPQLMAGGMAFLERA